MKGDETLLDARRVRALRGPKPGVDPLAPLGVEVELERRVAGGTRAAVTVFLAGAECPYTCVFCDLWRFTLDGPTPPGALPRQIGTALAGLSEPPPRDARIKLYNASNFFDRRAVPPADDAAIARAVAGFAKVTVESHPRLVGERTFAFAELLDGGLEVAMGLETAHPEALARLGKDMTLDDFATAAERLGAGGLGLRVFVLVGAPYLPCGRAVEWAVRSAALAFNLGAARVALIPVRGGNGTLEELAAAGEWTPPVLGDLEDALDGALELGRGIVTGDLWDLERFADCRACAAARTERLAAINLDGRPRPRITCRTCGSGDGR